MRNQEYPRQLHYTQLADPYNGYSIHWAVNRSDSDPNKWMGHFRALKDGAPTIHGSVVNLQDDEYAARSRAIEDAEFFVDEALAEQGRSTLDPWEVGDYRVYGYAVPALGRGFHPAYVVDRFRGIPDAPQIAVRFRVILNQVVETEGLAKVMAVSHGDQRVKSGLELLA